MMNAMSTNRSSTHLLELLGHIAELPDMSCAHVRRRPDWFGTYYEQ